ncbi:MAG: hypothetical protein WCD73_11855, partial [Pseudolabrys sp.]
IGQPPIDRAGVQVAITLSNLHFAQFSGHRVSVLTFNRTGIVLGLSPNAETQNTFLNSSSSNSFLGPNDLLGRRGAAILPLKPFP